MIFLKISMLNILLADSAVVIPELGQMVCLLFPLQINMTLCLIIIIQMAPLKPFVPTVLAVRFN